MTSISSTQSVSSNGLPQVAEVHVSQSSSSVSSSSGTRTSDSFLVLRTLEKLGLISPQSALGDVYSLLDEILEKLNEQLDEAELQEAVAGANGMSGLLATYASMLVSGGVLEAELEEKGMRIDSNNGELTNLRSRRDTLLEDRNQVDLDIANAGSAGERAALEEERQSIDTELDQVYSDIALLENDQVTLTAEVADLGERIAQRDVAMVLIVVAMAREVLSGDMDSQVSDNELTELTDEQVVENLKRTSGSDSQNRQLQNEEVVRQMFVDLVENKELFSSLAPVVMKIVMDVMAVPQGDVAPQLAGQETDPGGRLRMYT
jgi:hypothetical protein